MLQRGLTGEGRYDPRPAHLLRGRVEPSRLVSADALGRMHWAYAWRHYQEAVTGSSEQHP